MPDTAATVADLRRPEAYPASERPDRVTLVETHISWIFMTGRFAYKVARERLAAREAESGLPGDGRWDLYDRQRESFDLLDEVAAAERVIVDTSGTETETISAALRGAYLALLGAEVPTAGAARGKHHASRTGV